MGKKDHQQRESREKMDSVLSLLRNQSPLTPKQEKFCNTACVERFLKVKGDSVKKAARQLRACLYWREATGTDYLIADEFSTTLADGVAYVTGHDDDSRPIMVFRINQDCLKFHYEKLPPSPSNSPNSPSNSPTVNRRHLPTAILHPGRTPFHAPPSSRFPSSVVLMRSLGYSKLSGSSPITYDINTNKHEYLRPLTFDRTIGLPSASVVLLLIEPRLTSQVGKEMAGVNVRPSSSFSRSPMVGSTGLDSGLKPGLNGSVLVSSGIPDLDKILGGGFCLGSLVMVMEDLEAPHHMLLLRNFMAQGLVHNQPLLYASPSKDPRGFLGTLPSIMCSKEDKSRDHGLEQEKGLRIAWQYKKYFDGNNQTLHSRDGKQEYCSEFDLRRPLERHFLMGKNVECMCTQEATMDTLLERCSTILTQNSRSDGNVSCSGRIAIQSFCAPHCGYYNQDWDMLSFIKSLKTLVRSSNAIAMITFPHAVLSQSFSRRWQHLADTLLSVRAVPDDDKELATLLTGYKEMVGLLSIHKMGRINTQVPFVLETSTYSIKLHKKRSLVLECLNQAPVDGSSGSSYDSSVSCSGSSKKGMLDF